jgi:hypothetical protein
VETVGRTWNLWQSSFFDKNQKTGFQLAKLVIISCQTLLFSFARGAAGYKKRLPCDTI